MFFTYDMYHNIAKILWEKNAKLSYLCIAEIFVEFVFANMVEVTNGRR